MIQDIYGYRIYRGAGLDNSGERVNLVGMRSTREELQQVKRDVNDFAKELNECGGLDGWLKKQLKPNRSS